jgi:hypothetical protein
MEGAAMRLVRFICVSAAALLLTPSVHGAIPATKNFIVVAPDEMLAAEVLHEAELLRKHVALAYLGEELPAGVGQTIISVELSDTEDRATFWPVDHPLRTHHRLWLTTSRETATGPKLAHEITHLVLHVRYGDQLPAWVDEGFASMQDGPERVATRERILQDTAFVRRWPITEVLSRKVRISAHDQDAYAAAASLTEFLVARGDAPQALKFAAQGTKHGWEQAARINYGMSLSELETTWQKWLVSRVPSVAVRPAVSPISTTRRIAVPDIADEPMLPVSVSRWRTLR